MAGSFEGTREKKQSHSGHKRFCVCNQLPLARPIRQFSQQIFWGYGLGTIAWGMIPT